MSWDDLDRRMVGIAARRGQVMLLGNDNMESMVVLVCWRPRRRGQRSHIARVQYPNGNTVPVDTALVRPI